MLEHFFVNLHEFVSHVYFKFLWKSMKDSGLKKTILSDWTLLILTSASVQCPEVGIIQSHDHVILYTYFMASRGTVKLLLSEGNSFPGRPPNRWATDSLFPKKPRNKLPNLLYNLNKNNTYDALTPSWSTEFLTITQILETSNKFFSWPGNSLTVSWYQKSEAKLGNNLK